MLLGVIADDFTGAGDIASTLAAGGMRTRLFTRPDAVDGDGCEAGVVALKTRSIASADAVAQSLTALASLRAAGCRQFVFKYCSTFNSTEQGNIGPVAEALAKALGARGVVVCPAFPATGRTLYQGHLFVGDRLLSETGMAAHPLTPMTDPDIRRWLARSTVAAPGHVPHRVVRGGPAVIAAALAAADAVLVVVDAIDETDLRAIGAAIPDARLVTGASGIALGLPNNFRRRGLLGDASSAFLPNDGKALLLAGSCSEATRAQVRNYAARHPAMAIDVEALLEGSGEVERALSFVRINGARGPLIHSDADPAKVAAAQARHGAARVAQAVEALFGELARRAVGEGFTRLVIAGGETSGAVVTALELRALDLGPEIDPGVPALSAEPGLALALKSGNFGTADFLAKAARRLSSG